MQDRYLYKAKRIDNGEWVQGVPFEIEGKTVILINDNENLLRVHYLEENMWSAEIYAIEVDQSTICQCTDLKDKNGNLVWENDIAKDEKGNFYKAIWENNFHQFSWTCIKSNKGVYVGGNKFVLLDRIKGFEIEVIGNIFDNPELLESEG